MEVKPLDVDEFIENYTRLSSNARGETYESNARRLFEWLRNEGYIVPKDE